MRRFKQQLPEPEVRQILSEATNGVLSLVGTDGRPYGVPLSFVYDGRGAIFFHCAREGRKIESLRHCRHASFCTVALDDVQPAEFTTYYRSVIAEGRISIIESRDEIIAALRMLGDKYSPAIDSTHEIARALDRVCVLRLDIETVSGKEAIELTRRR